MPPLPCYYPFTQEASRRFIQASFILVVRPAQGTGKTREMGRNRYQDKRLDIAKKIDPRDLAPDELIGSLVGAGESEETARRVLRATVGQGVMDQRVWNRDFQVPKRVAAVLDVSRRLTLEQRTISEIDGFEKLLFRTPGGEAIETVLIPLHKAGAVSLCLSSQVGCPMGCAFCATARIPTRRNLATWEIVDQWIQGREVARSEGRRVTGTVFMGMGEPFLNYDRVMAAAELIRNPSGGALAAKAMTISTVGLVPEIERYTEEGRKYRLSISLGAAIEEKRRAVFPVAGRTPLDRLMVAVKRHARARGGRVMLSYVLISGFNVGEEDAEALARWVGDTPIRLSLIDVTDPTGRYLPPGPEELSAFRDALTRHLGQPVVRRYSGGADIHGACGTLAGRLN